MTCNLLLLTSSTSSPAMISIVTRSRGEKCRISFYPQDEIGVSRWVALALAWQ